MELPSDFEALPVLARTTLALVLDVSLKGALLLALAGVVAALMRQASASARHLVWCVAVCAALLLPLLALTLPAWPVTVPFFEETVTTLHRVLPTAPAEVPAGLAETVSPEAVPARATPVSGPTTSNTLPLPFYQSVVATLVQAYDVARAAPWTVWLLGIWLLGVVGVMTRFLAGAVGVMWLAFYARPVRDAGWLRLTTRVRQRLGLHRPVRLLRSPRAAMPMTWGLWRPVVLLPVGAGSWPEARRRCVLIHELAHIRRLDCLTQALAHLACALYWFNPLVWVAARAMRREREQACDDAVLVGGMRPSEYARHLLDIARTSRSTLVTPLSAVAMARPSQLEGRVVAILEARRSRHAPHRAVTAATLLIVGLMTLPLAAMRPAGPSPVAAEGGIKAIETSQGAGYRWADTLPWGAVLQVRSARGDVTVLPAQGRTAEVIAIARRAHDAASPPFTLVEQEGGVLICAAEPGHPENCAVPDTQHHAAEGVDFFVWVPEGIRLATQTEHGAVRAQSLRSDVRARTRHGDITVETAGFVEASSVHGDIEIETTSFGQAHSIHGDIRARLGQTAWLGTLPFRSDHGDLVLTLPADADTEIALEVGAAGQLRSALSLEAEPGTSARHFRTTLGTGGRRLTLRATHGNATILYEGTAPHAAEPLALRAVPPHEAAPAPAPSPWLKRFAARSETQRLETVRALANRDREGAIFHLGLVIGEDPSRVVRAQAAQGLGKIGCPDGIPPLLVALEDESPKVRRAAVEALGAIADERARAALAHSAEHDADAAVRRYAARTLDVLRHAAVRIAPPAPPMLAAPPHQTTPNVQTRAVLATAEALGVTVETRRVARVFSNERAFARYTRQLSDIGLKEATDETFVLARAIGVTPGYARAIQRAGLSVSLDGLIRLKAQNVTPAFVKQRVAESGAWVSVEMIVEKFATPSALPRIDARALRGPAAPEHQPE